ncbi:MAG TPA: chloride channel protein [Longimicrobiales bacterium]|nr:chloride channel protein [Longimicrobiales bacterium]
MPDRRHDPNPGAHEERTGSLAVAPSMDAALASVRAPRDEPAIGARTVRIAGIAILIGIAGGFIAEALMRLIGLISNFVFFQRIDTTLVAPTTERLGVWVIAAPVLGALIIGVMARFGSSAIRGHGIPEVMEKVLHGESRIPLRLMFLKPLSAAIAIGTGGPFGAEGPIIATGGALGSSLGQALHITADERKTLLASGAAAGMAATFGSPVSAVLLAIELLLFEYRARSIIPVALAAAAATGVRMILVGPEPVFHVPAFAQPGGGALAAYVVLGAIIGVAAAAVTRAVYWIEDAFERLPVHWMWWPAIGAVAVGVIGYFDVRTLSVGYVWIEQILSGEIVGGALLLFVILKFVSWSIYLGSGTSGGTLAPLFIIGGGLGAALGGAAQQWWPALGVEPAVAGLVGMAAIFAGASHALLASIVFAFETTRQPLGLLPLLAGCSAAYLVMLLLMRNSIMTEKLARRGTSAPTDYSLDPLTQVSVREAMSDDLITLDADLTLGYVRQWLASGAGGTHHQGFPVTTGDEYLVGVVTRRDLLGPEPDATLVRDVVKRQPVVIFLDSTLREAADHMVREGVGRLAVVSREQPAQVLGVITRSDLLSGHTRRLRGLEHAERILGPRAMRAGRRRG